MSTITLSCLVAGENPYENAFAVEIELVSFFRDVIKEKIDDNVKARDLKLWKVDISLKEENGKLDLVNTKINVNILEELGGVELLPLSKISKYFPSQPAKEHIQFIFTAQKGLRATAKARNERAFGGVGQKIFNITALKKWQEAGETFEEDDEVLAFKEYKEIEARKNGVNFESVGEVIGQNQLEPEDVILPMEKNEGLEIYLGFTPTRMIKPGRLSRLILPEPENNPVPPNIRTINIVAKILVHDRHPTLSDSDSQSTQQMCSIIRVI